MSVFIEDYVPVVKHNGLVTAASVDFTGSASVAFPAGTLIGGSSVSALGAITSATATAFTVASTATNYGLQVDESTGSAITGLKIKAAATGNGVALSALGGTNEALNVDGKGTGTVGINTIGSTSGLVTLGNTSSLAGAAVNGPLTVTSAGASSFAVGRLGATTPAFFVDSSAGTQVTGLSVTGAATGGTVAVAVNQGAGNANLTVDAKGSGTVKINNAGTSAGLVTIGNTTALGGAFVNGPMWGNRKVLASSGNTTLTAAMSGACMLFDVNSGVTYTLPVPVIGMTYDFLVSVSCTTNGHKVITDAGTTFLAGNALIAVDNTASKTWVGDGATHLSLNQTAASTNAKGGLIGSWARFTAVTATLWVVSALLVGGGTSSTPFATS